MGESRGGKQAIAYAANSHVRPQIQRPDAASPELTGHHRRIINQLIINYIISEIGNDLRVAGIIACLAVAPSETGHTNAGPFNILGIALYRPIKT